MRDFVSSAKADSIEQKNENWCEEREEVECETTWPESRLATEMIGRSLEVCLRW